MEKTTPLLATTTLWFAVYLLSSKDIISSSSRLRDLL
jgi:hypothetical protein